MRYGTVVTKLRKMIEIGEARQPVLFNGRYQCNSLHSPWWIDVNKWGGQILEQAIHIYDMCCFTFGNPKSVTGYMRSICHTSVLDYTVEDVSASVASFSSGAVAAIAATNCAAPRKWDALFDIIYQNVSVFVKNPDEAEAEVEYFSETVDHKFLADKDFIDIVKNDRKCICPIEEGILSLYYV